MGREGGREAGRRLGLEKDGAGLVWAALLIERLVLVLAAARMHRSA